MAKPTDPQDPIELKLELYKSLRSESASYVEKVPALWMQKFVLVGAVIAFLVAGPGLKLGANDISLVSWGIAAIPVLAALIDLKILEYGLHARAISRFITEKFPSPPEVGAWEQCMWGDAASRNILRLVRARSFTTGLVTAIPSLGLAVLAAAVLARTNQHAQWFWTLAGLYCIVYIAGAVTAWKALWPWVGRSEK